MSALGALVEPVGASGGECRPADGLAAAPGLEGLPAPDVVVGDAANHRVAAVERPGARTDVLAHDRADAVGADHRVAVNPLPARERHAPRVHRAYPGSWPARATARAAHRPPIPAPTITTRCMPCSISEAQPGRDPRQRGRAAGGVQDSSHRGCDSARLPCGDRPSDAALIGASGTQRRMLRTVVFRVW
jgi:hypothetical protein